MPSGRQVLHLKFEPNEFASSICSPDLVDFTKLCLLLDMNVYSPVKLIQSCPPSMNLISASNRT